MNGLLYGWLLALYPADLRREFGAEMRELFLDDLADARGLIGFIGVWWCALCEVLRVALPGQRTNPVVIVPAIAFVFSMLSQCGTVLTIRHSLAQESPQQVLIVLLFAIALPSVATAITALFVVRSGRVRVVSLELCSKSAI
jgi:hypothetical protein